MEPSKAMDSGEMTGYEKTNIWKRISGKIKVLKISLFPFCRLRELPQMALWKDLVMDQRHDRCAGHELFTSNQSVVVKKKAVSLQKRLLCFLGWMSKKGQSGGRGEKPIRGWKVTFMKPFPYSGAWFPRCKSCCPSCRWRVPLAGFRVQGSILRHEIR